MALRERRWRKYVPFPRRKTLERWRPGFETRKNAALIAGTGATLVFDIGANEGQYALRLRGGGYRGRMVSVEPLPEQHAMLEALAAKDPGWEIAPRSAVGREAGTLVLHRYNNDALTSALPPAAGKAGEGRFSGAERIEAPVATLDGLAAAHAREGDRVFVKIDVQGLEREVIAGGGGLLSRAVGAQLELSFSPLYEGEADYLELLGIMDGLGFRPAWFMHVQRRPKVQPEEQMDVVLIRK